MHRMPLFGCPDDEGGHGRPEPAVKGLRICPSVRRQTQSRQPIAGAYHRRRPFTHGQPRPIKERPLRPGSAELAVTGGLVLVSEAHQKLVRVHHGLEKLISAPVQSASARAPYQDQSIVGGTTRQHRVQGRSLPRGLTPTLAQRRTQGLSAATDRHARSGRHVHLVEALSGHSEHDNCEVTVESRPP